MPDLRVRDARSDDAATIADFQIRMARESEGMALDPPTVEAGVRAVFDDPTKGRYLVAEQDGRVVGCTLTVPEWSDWRNATVLWIHSLYVVPEARRRGAFRALYVHLKRIVEQSPDLAGLRLYVDKSNRVAQQVYDAMGMTCEHYDLYEWMK
ncbi:MAG: GNAT family N-acetyltransferase [Candidatus Brocadiae bacterium]|nr:GNAT family N-acetyltransferase [Candidatus Brocadiia bacterium]